MDSEHSGIFLTQLLPKRWHRECLRYAQTLEYHPAEVYLSDGDKRGFFPEPRIRSATNAVVPRADPIAREHAKTVNRLLGEKYRRVLPPGPSLSPLQIIRYGEGGSYRAHADTTEQTPHRYLSVLSWLDDAYEGGELYFPDLEYTYQPRAFHTLIFPAEYIHQAKPVIRGQKHVALLWVIGRPPMKWIG